MFQHTQNKICKKLHKYLNTCSFLYIPNMNERKTVSFNQEQHKAYKDLQRSDTFSKFVHAAFHEKIDRLRLERGELDKVYKKGDEV